jgi:hypothetical protein
MAQFEKPAFSEKEYEFAFTHEFAISHQHFQDFTFTMPNLRQEAKSPYDTRFDWNVEQFHFSKFFQYKIADFITKPRKKDHDFINYFGGSYYTYPIKKRSISQQNVMLHLLSKGGEDVSYTSPLFHQRKAFIENFRNHKICENSISFDPGEIPLISDDEQHYISYDVMGTKGVIKSDFKEIPLKKNIEKKEELKKTEEIINEIYFEKLFVKLNNIINKTYLFEENIKIPKSIIKGSKVLSCVYLVNNYFNVKWILYGD